MIKTILFTTALVAGFGITAASADNDQNDETRRAVLKGRQVVWETVPAEKPYALTGESRDEKAREAREARDERRRFEPQGRAGYRH